MIKNEKPCTARTQPYAELTKTEYGARIRTWLHNVAHNQIDQKGALYDILHGQLPTSEQLSVLRHVAARVLKEFAADKVDSSTKCQATLKPNVDDYEPVKGLIHGTPGTGKSVVIKLLRLFFEEALGWEHGEEFICVAFQNRMAAAVKGMTLHASAMLQRPKSSTDKSQPPDIMHMYTQNENLAGFW